MRSVEAVGGQQPTLEVERLSVSFERWGQKVIALRDVSFKVPQGQWLVLTGPNGSGKSTLLRAIAGEIAAISGGVRINGQDVATAGRGRARLVYLVRQDPAAGTVKNLTPHENLVVADEARAPRSDLDVKYRDLLGRIGLEARDRQPVATLSSGQRQALTLVIAHLRSAPILLLDEPFAALDAANARLGMDLLRELHRAGRTIMQVSHDPLAIAAIGQRVLTLDEGRVLADTLREPHDGHTSPGETFSGAGLAR